MKMDDDTRMWLTLIAIAIVIFLALQARVIDTRGWGQARPDARTAIEREVRQAEWCDQRFGFGMSAQEQLRCNR